MQGHITTYDKRKCEGRVQGDDGYIYRFKREHIAKAEDMPYLGMDMVVNFEHLNVEDDLFAAELTLVDPNQYNDLNELYIEPTDFVLSTSDLVDGYDVLDRALYPIYRSERTEQKALMRLRRECIDLGANGIVSYSIERKLKGAFGNGFYLYTAKGVPVVLAKRDREGEVPLNALKHRINQERVKKNHNMVVNTRIGMLVLKALGAVMIFIFTMGFILTGGL